MAQDDGRGALIGEFLQAFFSASSETQDDIIFAGVRKIALESPELIAAYPVISHLYQLMQKHAQGSK